jgi:hypothetical protein
MHTTPYERPAERTEGTAHVWVGAALVGMGHGDNRRAEHAARTGRHVVSAGTRIEVLEVYCSRCRVPYSEPASGRACAGPTLRGSVTLSRAG